MAAQPADGKGKETDETMKIKYIFCLLFFGFCSISVFPQIAGKIESLLNTEAVNYEQTVQIILEAADVMASPGLQEAFSFASDKGWLPKKAETGNPVKLGGVALLIMQAFDIKGGIFYTLFQNERYAYRELISQGIIHGRSDPDMSVSGEFLLSIIGQILSRREAGVL